MKNRISWFWTTLLSAVLLFAAAPVSAAQTVGAKTEAKPHLNTQPQVRLETIPGTPENLRVRIEQLEKEVEVLQGTVNAMAGQVSQLNAELAQTRKLAEPPICEDYYHSKRPGTGVSVACSPYACEPSSGLCRTRCTNSNDCAPRFICDPAVALCVASQ